MRRLLWLSVTATSAALLACAAYLWMPRRGLDVQPPSADVVAGLRSVVISLGGTDPETPLRDLSALHPLLADRRIVAMGEATHGTHEFFRAQHRMFRYLVEREGFTRFGMEVSPEAGKLANAFIQGGEGSASQTVHLLGLWPWATVEVRDLLQWMREYNASAEPGRRIDFFGFSVWGADRDRRMADEVTRYVESDADSGRVFLWAHNAHVSTRASAMGHYLRERWGAGLYVIGLEFDEGRFRMRSMKSVRGVSFGVGAVAPAGPEFYVAPLAELNDPVLFLDLGTAMRLPALSAWLRSRRLTHSIDEMYRLFRVSRKLVTWADPWPDIFDGVFFVRTTTPAQGV